MKLTVKRTELLRTVRLARQLTSPPNKAANYFHLLADETGLTVHAVMDNYVRIPVGGDVLDPGEISVERGRFQRILEILPDDNLRLSADKDYLNFNEQVYLPCQESYLTPQALVPPNLSVDYSVLRRAVERVLPHVYKDEGRPISYIKNEIKNGIWRMVGTNGFVLSMVSMVFTDWEGEFLLPYQGMQRMVNYKAKGEAKFAITEDTVCWQLPGDVWISMNVGLEKYPSYESILPKQWNTRIKVNRDLLTRHLSMAQLFAGSAFLDIERDRLVVHTKDEKDGHYCSYMPVEMEGEPLSIAFDPNLLKQALAGDTIEFTTDVRPCVVKGEDCEVVIMPQHPPR